MYFWYSSPRLRGVFRPSENNVERWTKWFIQIGAWEDAIFFKQRFALPMKPDNVPHEIYIDVNEVFEGPRQSTWIRTFHQPSENSPTQQLPVTSWSVYTNVCIWNDHDSLYHKSRWKWAMIPILNSNEINDCNCNHNQTQNSSKHTSSWFSAPLKSSGLTFT